MTALFLKVLNMSITASYVMAVILLARRLLRRVPKKYTIWLWAAAGFRLCCPVSFQSGFSLFSLPVFDMGAAQSSGPALTYIPAITPVQGAAARPYTVTTGLPAVNAILPQPDPTQTLLPGLQQAAAFLWCLGVAALVLWALGARWRLSRQLRTATRLQSDVWQSGSVRSPFILGLLRPRIYIPYSLEGEALQHVLAHEQAHIRHRDQLLRPAAFALLTLHWFNPLCWLCFKLFVRDMELRCDQEVLERDPAIRADYSRTLLAFAAPGRFAPAGPLAFGESGAAARIKAALNFKKLPAWVLVLAALACIALVLFLAADPTGAPFDIGHILWIEADQAEVAAHEYDDLLARLEGASYRPIANASGVPVARLYAGNDLYYELRRGDTVTVTKVQDGATAGSWTLRDFEEDLEAWQKYRTRMNYLLGKYPEFFFPETPFKGYELYIRPGGYSLTYGTNRHKTEEEINALPAAPEADMRDILAAQGLEFDTMHKLYFPQDSQYPALLQEPEKDLTACIRAELLARAKGYRGDLMTVAFLAADWEEKGDVITHWLWVRETSWSYRLEGMEDTGGSSYPCVISFRKERDGRYTFLDFRMPRDGSYYAKDLKDLASAAQRKALDEASEDPCLEEECRRQMEQHLQAAPVHTLESLFARAMASPSASSNPGDYIAAHPEEWGAILGYKQAAFEFCVGKFLEGSQTGLAGHLYALAMEQLTGGELAHRVTDPGTGQGLFDSWLAAARARLTADGAMEMEKHAPWSYLLLQLADR